MASTDERSEMEDKVKEFFEAGKKGEYGDACDAFEDLCALMDNTESDNSDEKDEGESESGKATGKPLAALLISKK
ncbi:MAG TPA: hypothetical protein VJ860_06910 [Polyangia bacterium]|jgi:hypothetical protein|nr:hypothetical protein [Polyangia bacterium]